MFDALATLDSRIALWLHAHATPEFTRAMLWVTEAHSQIAIIFFSILFAAWAARRREWQWVRVVALAIPLGLAINTVIKDWVQRARPRFENPLVTLDTWSFPSGHTSGATLVYGILVAYVFAHTPRRGPRAAALAGGLFMVSLVAFTRLYLGAHYLTDVIAAFAWALAWLVVVFSLVLRPRRGGMAS